MFDVGIFVVNPKAEIAKDVFRVFYHGGHYQKTTGSDGSSLTKFCLVEHQANNSGIQPTFSCFSVKSNYIVS